MNRDRACQANSLSPSNLLGDRDLLAHDADIILRGFETKDTVFELQLTVNGGLVDDLPSV